MQGKRHQRMAAGGLAMFIITRVSISGTSPRSSSSSENSRMPS